MSGPVSVPYLGLFARDCLFLHEGNPDTFDNGAINWEKAQLQAKLVTTYRKFQESSSGKSKWVSNEEIQSFLNNVHPMEDDELHRESLECEPRASDAGVYSL